MRFLFVFLMLAGFTACQSDDDHTDSPSNYPPRPLTVMVEDVTTRGTIITANSLQGFSMNYQANQYNATKTESGWNTVLYSWPDVGNDDKIDFYAYNGGTFQYNSGVPYINFTAVDETPASTTDLLVAKHKQISYNDGYNGEKGVVTLTFDHACAAVDFNIRSKKAEPVTIREVILNDVKKTGRYHYDTDSWDNIGNESTTTYYLHTGNPFTLATDETNTLDALGTVFFIPQTLSTVTVRYTVNDANKKATFTLDKALAKGESYTINIEL